MTQEEKQLLLKDLSGRYLYKVKFENPHFIGVVNTLASIDPDFNDDNPGNAVINGKYSIELVKPYLRPMSSMTKEERKEYNDIVKNTIDFYDCPKSEEVCLFVMPIDWLNKKQFDYRGLIPMGLAIEAPKDMYV